MTDRTLEADPKTFDLDAPLEQGQDVAVREGGQPATRAPQDDPVAMVDPVLAQAAAIARLPGLNEGMFDRLMAWQERERSAQAEERFNEAMNAAQREIEPVARTTENKQIGNFFAKLEAVDAAIRPIYSRHGFAVKYNTVPPLSPGNIRVECAVSLGRHTERFYREAPPDTVGPQGKAVKTLLHGGGSSETFLKRYAVCGAFNVVFRSLTDDDGVRGGQSFISPDQAQQLRDMLAKTKRKEVSFIGRMASDLDGKPLRTFDDLEVKDFLRVSNTLALIIQQEGGGDDEQEGAQS